eukprot:m.233694 g.233694  ORF g.233694 m.233694 type:complete len:280 (+) comp40096_c0_seq1:1127-1966(+)
MSASNFVCKNTGEEWKFARAIYHEAMEFALKRLTADGVHVFILMDEIQAWFQWKSPEGFVDMTAVKSMQSQFKRFALCWGLPRVHCCLTGSSMIEAWVNISRCRPNGTILSFAMFCLNLPAQTSKQAMAIAADHLKRNGQADFVDKNEEIIRDCHDLNPALLSFAVELLAKNGKAQSMSLKDVLCHIHKKMALDLWQETAHFLQDMPETERLYLRQLVCGGVKADQVYVLRGWYNHLLPFTSPSKDGKFKLVSKPFKQFVCDAITPEGKLKRHQEKSLD